MDLTVITTACHRPEAWSLCESYMARQTVKPFQWLVLDDDETKTVCTMGQEYHYWPEMRGRGSLSKKVRRAMGRGLVKGDAIVFVENDDWYPDDYLEWCAASLHQSPIIGEGRALYYNVKNRSWFEHANLSHASLCATAITREAFPHLIHQVTISECPFLDVRIWNKPPVAAKVFDPYRDGDRKRRSVGIKAMPGRAGYGGGHSGRDASAQDDLSLVKLRKLIGTDAEAYAKFYAGPQSSTKPVRPERNMHTHIAFSECGRVHGPNWLSWLGHLRGESDVIGAEIGTFKGDSAQWMLDNIFTHPTSKYHCIDPFTGSIEHHVRKMDMSTLEKDSREKLKKYANVEIHKGYSQDVLRTWRGKLDFLYVDGDHTARGCLRDSVLGFDLLNHRGVMIFDDYPWAEMPNELDRPKLAIDVFLRVYARQLKVLPPRGYQIAIQKTE